MHTVDKKLLFSSLLFSSLLFSSAAQAAGEGNQPARMCRRI